MTVTMEHQQEALDFVEGAVRRAVDFHPEEPVFESWLLNKTREELETQGWSKIPAIVTRSGWDATLTDDLLGVVLSARQISEATGLSVSTVRRMMGLPDARLGRGNGWFPSHVRHVTGKNVTVRACNPE